MLFQTPAQIQSIRTLIDGGNKLEIITQELSADEMTKLFSLRKKTGYFLFKENLIDVIEVPHQQADFNGNLKTPSMRIRNVLYVLWQQSGSQGDFETFYNNKMNNIIEKLKEKLI